MTSIFRLPVMLIVAVLCLGGCVHSNSPGQSQEATITATQATAPTPSNLPSRQLAQSAYGRFKKLDGDWDTKSTKGWGGHITYKVITGGACVMQTDAVAHEGDTMVTMIHPDGDRLLLTHYCAARNQPRLVATQISPDASEITFEFLDATNLSSRNKGHMDKVVFKFKSDDEFTDQWTWYQDGKETWEEEITNVRVK